MVGHLFISSIFPERGRIFFHSEQVPKTLPDTKIRRADIRSFAYVCARKTFGTNTIIHVCSEVESCSSDERFVEGVHQVNCFAEGVLGPRTVSYSTTTNSRSVTEVLGY